MTRIPAAAPAAAPASAPAPAAPPRRWAAVIAAALAVVGLLLVLTAQPAGAHPLGNFTVNHASELVISARSVEVDLVVDLAEIPTQQQRAALSDAPKACDRVAGDLELRVDGDRRALRTRTAEVAFPVGEASLPTTRLECRFDAAVELPDGPTTIEYHDRSYADRIGWREIIVTPIGVEVPAGTPTTSPSKRLTDYGRSLANPPDQRTLSVTVTVPATADGSGDTAAAAFAADEARPAGAATTSVRRQGGDPFTDLVARADDGLVAATLALGVAALLGAMHGLAPGHGKTVVAAYLVGTRGNRRQAVGLAAAVALSHTLGVFALGGLTLVASATFPLERIFGWLRLTSAVVILTIGLVFAWRLVSARRAAASLRHHHHHGHDHHGHEHHDHHGHHEHHHHGHDEHHGFGGHRHAVAWDDVDTSRPLGWRALVALGLSGGMVPSASAILVLLGAVQLGRVAFGAGLILAFGVGLSSALVGVGLGVVAVARRTSGRLDTNAVAARLNRLFAPGAATGLVLAGCYLSVRAIGQLA